jgi:hypothetical protein
MPMTAALVLTIAKASAPRDHAPVISHPPLKWSGLGNVIRDFADRKHRAVTSPHSTFYNGAPCDQKSKTDGHSDLGNAQAASTTRRQA